MKVTLELHLKGWEVSSWMTELSGPPLRSQEWQLVPAYAVLKEKERQALSCPCSHLVRPECCPTSVPTPPSFPGHKLQAVTGDCVLGMDILDRNISKAPKQFLWLPIRVISLGTLIIFLLQYFSSWRSQSISGSSNQYSRCDQHFKNGIAENGDY